MRPLTRTICFKDGVKAEMLFTPHLYSFRGQSGASLEYSPGNDREIYETYADIMFLAAINAWVLDGHGEADNVPFTRGDFHAWMQSEPHEFGKVMAFAIESLTGKTITEIAEQAKEQKLDPAEASDLKKKRSAWIGRRLRKFWLGDAD